MFYLAKWWSSVGVLEGRALSSGDMLPSVDQIAKALGPIVKMGLPVYPEFADETLLGLPGVLNRSHDPDDILSRVKALDDLLTELLARYPDDVLQEVAGILLGAKTGSRRQPIGERRKAVAKRLGVGAEHVRTGIQPKVIKTLAWELHRDSQDATRSIMNASSSQIEQSVRRATADGRALTPEQVAVMSPEAYREARQLCFYAQEAAVLVEVFDVAVRAIGDLRQRHECWPTPRYIASRGAQSERALWAFAHCCAHLRNLERDDTGREFLAEHFPVSPWHMGLRSAFSREGITDLQLALAEAAIDEPGPFYDALLARESGVTLEWDWLKLMSEPALRQTEESAPSTSAKSEGQQEESQGHFWGEARFKLWEALSELAEVLEPMFPEQVKISGVTVASYYASTWTLVSYEMPEGGPNIGPYYERMMMSAVTAARKQMQEVWEGRKAPAAAGVSVKQD